MLRTVLEIFFAGQIIAEKLIGELSAKCEAITDQLKCNTSEDRQQNIDVALEAVKTDYKQVSTATQKLLQNLGDLASAYVPIKVPSLSWEFNLTEMGHKKTNHKEHGQATDGAEHVYEGQH